ncbi:hypothetical protein [Streptomyces neyagawaensis]|uniref:hypothetical protein n=1 Tax=Streptomyces neyagawaensis TaxID=42238 RepID=UPI0006E244FB|nr:hypothetical protein [Streptomyces neyagawaensis]MCL6735888.1 hypothetical protein [Streptomyces neyagawaensis]MDE1686308.1 hypothetical protein [Streptomyces neyagawaensis]
MIVSAAGVGSRSEEGGIAAGGLITATGRGARSEPWESTSSRTATEPGTRRPSYDLGPVDPASIAGESHFGTLADRSGDSLHAPTVYITDAEHAGHAGFQGQRHAVASQERDVLSGQQEALGSHASYWSSSSVHGAAPMNTNTALTAQVKRRRLVRSPATAPYTRRQQDA